LIKLYKRFLETALGNGWSFGNFINNDNVESRKQILLQHDMDYYPDAALEMARTESALNVKATYMVYLRSPFYNTMSRSVGDMLSEIHELGHWIGLHTFLADISDYPSIM